MNKQTGVAHFPQVARLLEVMNALRDPLTGCPWDRQQTFESIVPFTIEEAYEVADAIEHGDMQNIQDELGDLLFQVVFYAQLGKEQQIFDFEAIARTVADKLIRRHPHVFAAGSLKEEAQLNAQWESIKQQERAEKGCDDDSSILANTPAGMAPLMRALKLQKKCARVGFDWPEVAPVVAKVREEIDEVMAEVERPSVDQNAIEEEIGDLLFAVVNLSRHLKVEAETALRKANKKFEGRFRQLESTLKQQDIKLEQANLEQMEQIWQQVKSQS